jgi:hypothetical protein
MAKCKLLLLLHLPASFDRRLGLPPRRRMRFRVESFLGVLVFLWCHIPQRIGLGGISHRRKSLYFFSVSQLETRPKKNVASGSIFGNYLYGCLAVHSLLRAPDVAASGASFYRGWDGVRFELALGLELAARLGTGSPSGQGQGTGCV